jgi:putative ABC transport system permease protein
VSTLPPAAWLALARRLVAARHREEAEGDLIELWTRGHERRGRPPTVRFWREALSLAIASRRRSRPGPAAPDRHFSQKGFGMAILHDLAQDTRYALRFLRRAPGFSLASVSMLTFGIGLVAGAYSVVNGLLLRPWAVPRSGEVVVASAERRGQPAAGRIRDGFSFGAYEHIRAHARAADYVAMKRNYLSATAQRGERVPGRVPEAIYVSENFVEVLGLPLQRGTGLDSGAAPGSKVILSDALWRRRFNADPDIVGRTVWLSREQPATVVGIMAPTIDSLGAQRLDLVVDLPSIRVLGRVHAGLLDDPTSCCVNIAGRLRSGWTREQAREELVLLTAQYRQSVGKAELAVALRDTTPSRELGRPGPLVFALIGTGLLLVFLLTCANVGNLYLARSLGRRPEIAVRLSLGASRARLVRQLLTEGLVMAVLAGAGAFLVARIVPLVVFLTDEGPASRFVPDWRVGVVTAAAVVVACLLVALAPALQSTRIAWRGATTMISARTGRMRGAVLAAQIAIAAVLTMSAALLARGVLHAARAPTDYALHSTTMATVSVPEGRTYDSALVATLAGAAGASGLRQEPGMAVTLPGHPLGFGRSTMRLPSAVEFQIELLSLSRAAFDVLQVPLVAGRWPSADLPAGEALVNETLARRLAPVSSVLGQTFTLSFNRSGYAIVGVVRDAHLTAFDQVAPMVFVPPAVPGVPVLLARSGPEVERQLTALVESVDPGLGLTFVPLSETAKQALRTATGGAAIAASLGLVALLLAIVGVGGVFSYLVEEQRREIGIRLALGGSRAQIAGTLARACRGAVAGGLAAGLALSIAAGIGLRSFLFGLHPLDPVSYGAVGIVLMASALIATALPLRRALRVDPAVTLRAD